MAVWQDRSQTKKTGGRTRSYRKSRKYDLGSKFTEPEVGEKRTKIKKTRGGNQKAVAKRSETVNLAVNGEVKNVEIDTVEDNPANPNYVRRSILTKGTIIQTPEGKAKITSRPGQEGSVSAKLIE